MPVRPSGNEEEYFAREEFERRKQAASERQAHIQAEELKQQRELHYMRCPKCGMQLDEITFGDVQVDECFNCGGMWLDKGELEKIRGKDAGFVGKLLGVFRI